MKICDYCKKEIKQNELYCTNSRIYEPHYEEEPIYHLECYSKAVDKAREYMKQKGAVRIMEFIEPEEFLKQDKEVQEVINNSIKLNIGDRIYHKLSKKYYIYLGEYNEAFWNVFDLEDKCTSVVCKDYFYRCLCEGQLRQFITNNNEKSLRINWSSWSNYNNRKTFNYEFILSEWGEIGKVYEVNDCEDLLQAYLKVAVQIAKESLK